jgi:diguanylate cyclase (GGDEF)-like protein
VTTGHGTAAVVDNNDSNLPQDPDLLDERALHGSVLRWLAIALAGATVLLPLLAAVWMVHTLSTPASGDTRWAIAIAIAVAAVAVAAWGSIDRRLEWVRPARRLRLLLESALEGDLPIEAVRDVGGGIEPLAAVSRRLLHELKRQRAAVAELKDEMRQRVASRTDALERKIGMLQLQAMRDPLTSLYNRRALEQELHRRLKDCADPKAADCHLCLLMIDLDHFKTLNDTLGHAAGDKLLREVGQVIRSTLRADDEDLGFRCGGDEFVVLLGKGDLDAGKAVAARLESLVEHLAKPLRVPYPVRLSIGIASASEIDPPLTAEKLLHCADQRLYTVKDEHHRQAGTTARRAG